MTNSTTETPPPAGETEIEKRPGRRPKSPTNRAMGATRTYGPGLLLAAAVSAISLLVAGQLAAISALTIAIIIGVLLRNAKLLPAATKPGVTFAAKRLLRLGVVLLGLQLSIPQILALRPGEIVTLIVTVVVTFLATRWLGPRIGASRRLSLLVATGFSICGASAVAAMSAVVDTDDDTGGKPTGRGQDDVATAITLVTLFGSLAILVLPLLQGFLGFDDHQMGVWVGASVHDVAQTVATAAAVSTAALTVAIVVKLGRVVLLAPLVAIVGALERRRQAAPQQAGAERRDVKRPPVVPLFVVGFLAMVALRSSGILPDDLLAGIKVATTALLTAAMFGLGTGVHVATLVRTGGRAALLGAIASLIAMAVAATGIHLVG